MDSHQLIPQSMWLFFVSLLLEAPHELSDLQHLPLCAEWRPLEPLVFLIASLTASDSSEDKLLSNRVLDACLGIGSFKTIHSSPMISTVLLLYVASPTVRMKAAAAIARNLKVAADFAGMLLPVVETLRDFLIFSGATEPITDGIFEDLLSVLPSMANEGMEERIGCLANALDLLADDVACVNVRCAAGERALAILVCEFYYEFLFSFTKITMKI